MASPCYCVVCAVRLQFKILWQGYIKKYEKFKVSPTGTPTDYNPSVFHRELKNIYGIMPLSPTDHTRWYFIESCKNIYGIVPQSPTCTPTDFPTDNTDGFTHIPKPTHVRHVSAAQIPTDWPTSNTNGFTHIPKRIACQTRVRLHEYRRICRRIKKSGGIFELFWCAFQLIFDGITDGI
jgi:hypothetical protein